MPSCLPYTDLLTTTNFTFLRGASHPEELVEQAAVLGHGAAAITDRNSVAGIVRGHVAAKQAGIDFVVGTELHFETPDDLVVAVYPTDVASYGRMCRLLTIGKRRATKGSCRLEIHDLLEHHEGLLAIVVPPARLDEAFVETMEGLRRCFDDDRLSVALIPEYRGRDRQRLAQVSDLAAHVHVPTVASNRVQYHVPARRALHDVLACIREGCTLPQAGHRLHPHAEHHLKPAAEMARLLAAYPAAIERTGAIAARATAFNLDQLRYRYPHEVCPPGRSPIGHLADLARRGAVDRYPGGVPAHVEQRIEHELRLIDELDYAPYFLTVHDLVVFARSRGILCQGRGAAANSAVCYCLGVTAVDPDRIDLLFERFVSKERNEPPDIDIDFEHERREEVIQYIYRKYGRDRAALTAEVITYRGRSAVREVGKALGLSLDCVDRMARNMEWWHDRHIAPARFTEIGVNPADPTIQRFAWLLDQVMGFPRHLSQHVGGFVITEGPLCELVPVENAAMADRTVIEWDKDDIDAMGMLKVDVLGLGMLTCIRKGLEFVNQRRGHEGTEARRHEGGRGVPDDRDQDLSGSHCLESEHGTGQGGVCRNKADASGRKVRSVHADAKGCGVDPVQHRGGVRSPVDAGLPAVSAKCEGVTGRAIDSGATGEGNADAGCINPSQPIECRDGSSAAGVDPKHRESASNLNPSCLRASVPSCLELHTIPPEDPTVYHMICAADTIGVFQIESRAQMSMLPRLRPRCFYDLVIEVAIVRPGPIQGDMVHPYLRRRRGEEPVTYPSPDVEHVLGKTLGVPLFQEQAMALAMVAAGFTAGEADQLRRAMAAWKRKGDQIERFGKKLIAGMLERGYEQDFAERCFAQIRGFSEYGFPESHAASFALLVYVSAWLKKHEPAAFAAALINSQPMGFYAPAQIVRDAEEHGVEVRAIDVGRSGWDCSLEERHEGTEARRHEGKSAQPALRLGMRLVKGLREEHARMVETAVRERGPFASIEMLWRESGVPVGALRKLAAADAFNSMGADRQAALWQIRALRDERLPMFAGVEGKTRPAAVDLPAMPELRKVMEDYAAAHLSLRAHPLSFIRGELDRRKVIHAVALQSEHECPTGLKVSVAGIALIRQRPSTASGVVFMTLEDETGIANLILRPKIYNANRQAARHGIVVLAHGTVERDGAVVHVLTERVETLDERYAGLVRRSRDFR